LGDEGLKVDDMERLERTERMMARWMCAVSLRDREFSVVLLELLSVVGVTEVVRRGRLLEVCRGRNRKTWMQCVEEDMKLVKLCRDDAPC